MTLPNATVYREKYLVETRADKAALHAHQKVLPLLSGDEHISTQEGFALCARIAGLEKTISASSKIFLQEIGMLPKAQQIFEVLQRGLKELRAGVTEGLFSSRSDISNYITTVKAALGEVVQDGETSAEEREAAAEVLRSYVELERHIVIDDLRDAPRVAAERVEAEVASVRAITPDSWDEVPPEVDVDGTGTSKPIAPSPRLVRGDESSPGIALEVAMHQFYEDNPTVLASAMDPRPSVQQ